MEEPAVVVRSSELIRIPGKSCGSIQTGNAVFLFPVQLMPVKDRMLITGGYEAGAAMIKVEKKADGTYGVTELYKNADFGAHTQPPVLYNGYFYAQYTTNERKDGLVCMSIDGQIKWKTGKSPAI